MLDSKLPKEYVPFRELEICSNQFVNGLVPIEVRKNAVLLVGNGEQPVVWLLGPVSKEGEQFKEIVTENRSLNKVVDVKVFPENNSTIVKVGDITILKVTKTSKEKAVVSKIDLRPLGLNIHGDASELTIGTNKLASNMFTNVRTMIGIDK